MYPIERGGLTPFYLKIAFDPRYFKTNPLKCAAPYV